MTQKTLQNSSGRNKNTKSLIFLSIVLLSCHIMLSHMYTKTILEKQRGVYESFYVFSLNGYKLLATGFDDLASRLNVQYALFSKVNFNIPSIDFDRLMASMDGTAYLDPQNISPYLTIVYYWSWAKAPEKREKMADFLIKGMDLFPEVWQIPYGVYTLLEKIDTKKSIEYMKIASNRAIEFGGPEWVIGFPAILLRNDGQDVAGFLWLVETIKATHDHKQQLAILERMKDIYDEYEGDQKENMLETIEELEKILKP